MQTFEPWKTWRSENVTKISLVEKKWRKKFTPEKNPSFPEIVRDEIRPELRKRLYFCNISIMSEECALLFKTTTTKKSQCSTCFGDLATAPEALAGTFPAPQQLVFSQALIWEAADLGNCPKRESSRKWLGEGAKGLLDPASKRPLALVQNGVAPVQKRVWVVQKTLGRPLLPGPKRVKKTFCTLAKYGFGEHGFKHRTQQVFWGSPISGQRTH